jgi:isoquinoline 1-oxidoreductase beta subunit
MKNLYGTSFPAPENQQRDLSLPAAAAILAAPKTASEIARLTREAYQKHGGARTVELLAVDRRAFLGTVFSAGAMVLGANLLTDQATAATTWQPSVYLGFEPDGQIVITAHRSEMGTGSRTSLPLVVADELDVDWKTVRV